MSTMAVITEPTENTTMSSAQQIEKPAVSAVDFRRRRIFFIYEWAIENFSFDASLPKEKEKNLALTTFIIREPIKVECTMCLISCNYNDLIIKVLFDKEIPTVKSNSLCEFVALLDAEGKAHEILKEEGKNEYLLRKEVILDTNRKYFLNHTLKFQCRFSVNADVQANPLYFEVPTNSVNFEKLSSDIAGLCDESASFGCFIPKGCLDVIVQVGEQKYFLEYHKAILWSRCPLFSKLIDEFEITNPIDKILRLPNLILELESSVISSEKCQKLERKEESNQIFNEILRYIYSGRVCETLPTNDCFRLYFIAEKCGLRGLTQYFNPSVIRTRTQFVADKTSFTWTVGNFSSLKRGAFAGISSPYFTSGLTSSLKWKLALRVFEDQIIHLCLENASDFPEGVRVDFTFSVVQENSLPFRFAKYTYWFGPKQGIAYPGLFDADSRFKVSEFLNGDTLTVRCNLCVFDGNTTSESEISHSPPLFDFDLSTLSTDLHALFESGKHYS